MIRRIRRKPKLLAGLLLVVGVPWILTEWMFSGYRVLLSSRLAVVSGLFFFPILYILYRYGFRGDITQTLKSVGLSFLIKGVFLAGTTTLFYVTIRIQPFVFATLLFFLIFSLTFFAISLAGIEDPAVESTERNS